MANPHFAKLGDVWKHLPLVEALRREPPAAYCETHAGAAWYPRTPTPERRYGVDAFLERAPGIPELATSRYLAARARLENRDRLKADGSSCGWDGFAPGAPPPALSAGRRTR